MYFKFLFIILDPPQSNQNETPSTSVQDTQNGVQVKNEYEDDQFEELLGVSRLISFKEITELNNSSQANIVSWSIPKSEPLEEIQIKEEPLNILEDIQNFEAIPSTYRQEPVSTNNPNSLNVYEKVLSNSMQEPVETNSLNIFNVYEEISSNSRQEPSSTKNQSIFSKHKNIRSSFRHASNNYVISMNSVIPPNIKSVDEFFKAMAKIVKKLSPHLIREARYRIWNTIGELELRNRFDKGKHRLVHHDHDYDMPTSTTAE